MKCPSLLVAGNYLLVHFDILLVPFDNSPGDDLSKFLMTYADKETFNSSTKESLQEFAAHIAAVQDYKDSEVATSPILIYRTQNCNFQFKILKSHL